MNELKICTAYRVGNTVVKEMPGDTAQLALCEPVYESVPGWSAPTLGLTRFDDLPAEAIAYIARLEEATGVPCAVVSTGSERDHTIIRDRSIVAKLSRP
jgi:adenylosuccinate synthase